MNTLTGHHRKRAKHLLHNRKVQPLSERTRIMQWAINKWGRSTTFGPNYAKYFYNHALNMGLSMEVTRLRIKVWAFNWETWAFAYKFEGNES